jgi:hypothetical protein
MACISLFLNRTKSLLHLAPLDLYVYNHYDHLLSLNAIEN